MGFVPRKSKTYTASGSDLNITLEDPAEGMLPAVEGTGSRARVIWSFRNTGTADAYLRRSDDTVVTTDEIPAPVAPETKVFRDYGPYKWPSGVRLRILDGGVITVTPKTDGVP
jgi:hypothetical protein